MAEVYDGLVGEMFSSTRDEEILQMDDVPFTDEDWVSDSFMVSGNDMEETYNYLRFTSTADVKFTDTSLGGNISINCHPQYTRYADVRSVGLYGGRQKVSVSLMSSDNGMGRYYSEAIDDNSTNVYFEFGLAKHNNILMYTMGAVDYRKAVIANTARTPFFYDLGWIFGTGALIVAFPIIAPVLLLSKFLFVASKAVMTSNGKFDQYYLNPTMFLYWSSVNTMVTMMATELGILSSIFEKNDPKKIGSPIKVDVDSMEAIQKLMPDIISDSHGINVHAMVSKSQKLYIQMHEAKLEALERLTDLAMDKDAFTKFVTTTSALDPLDPLSKDEVNTLWKKLHDPITKDENFTKEKKEKKTSFSKLLKELQKSGKDLRTAFGPNKDGTVKKNRPEDEEGFFSKALETAKVVHNEGARYAVFRVEHLSSSTESFSNSVDEMTSTNLINSLGETYRNLKFNVGIDGLPGIGTVINAVTDFAIGATSGVTLGVSDVIGGILSGAKLDVQKKWTNSSVSFPSQTFKMSLVSPSAHPVAQLRNLYIPLACIMSGMLPLETGPRSSTSPFLCSMFVRGRQQINLGMITSLSITRGTSNLPFNKQRRPLAIDVTFTVTDFNELISAPMPNGLLDFSSAMFDDESGLSRYIQALCGRDLYSSTHVFERSKIKLARIYETVDLVTSPEFIGAKVGDMTSNNAAFSVFSGKKALNYSEMW
jgi:hypothetical protein